MILKEFNNEYEDLKRKNKNKFLLIFSIVLICLSVSSIFFLNSYAFFSASEIKKTMANRTVGSQPGNDIIINSYYNNAAVTYTVFPDYTTLVSSSCTNGASAIYNSTTKKIDVSNITTRSVTCNVYLRSMTAKEIIIANNIVRSGTPTTSAVSTNADAGLYQTPDDYTATTSENSYIFRGSHTNINNNLIFGGFQWKIIRITGEDTIKLIYNGTCPGNSCTINTTETTTRTGNSQYHSSYGSNRFGGYMIGSGDSSTTTHNNSSNSTIKNAVDNWYAANITTAMSNQIADTIFCNDRSVYSGTGIGTANTVYMGSRRNVTLKVPSLICSLERDQFTLTTSSIGNKKLKYPVALITADESSFGGIVSGTTTNSSYLYVSYTYHTMTLNGFGGSDPSIGNFKISNTYFTGFVYATGGVRPVIALKSTVIIKSGTGSATNPFIIET